MAWGQHYQYIILPYSTLVVVLLIIFCTCIEFTFEALHLAAYVILVAFSSFLSPNSFLHNFEA